MVLLVKERDKILIYDGIPILEKIYEYRKNEMESQNYPIVQARVDGYTGATPEMKEFKRSIKYFEFKDLSLINKDILKEKSELLEIYYTGKIFEKNKYLLTENVDKTWTIDECSTVLIPKEINIIQDNMNFYTSDIIHLNYELCTFEKLVDGTIQDLFELRLANLREKQLECFDFQIADEISISNLLKLIPEEMEWDLFNKHILHRSENGKEILKILKKSK